MQSGASRSYTNVQRVKLFLCRDAAGECVFEARDEIGDVLALFERNLRHAKRAG